MATYIDENDLALAIWAEMGGSLLECYYAAHAIVGA